MTSSLVGSEMCIRDSMGSARHGVAARSSACKAEHRAFRAPARLLAHAVAVSYTHLTLPTICSV
eukprot:1091272-Prorocentrum_lima.AAC.1